MIGACGHGSDICFQARHVAGVDLNLLQHVARDRFLAFDFVQRLENGVAPRGGVGAAIIRDIVKQMNEDIPIWESKAYLQRPILCDGDGPIAEFRRWSQQFYS